MKKSGFAIVKVTEFKGENASPDKNGSLPMYLHPVAGEIPNRNVLSGTVASQQGFVENKTYLAQWSLGDVDPQYGQQVNWNNISGDPLSAMEVISTSTSPLFNSEAGSIFELTTSVKAADKSNDTKAAANKAKAQVG